MIETVVLYGLFRLGKAIYDELNSSPNQSSNKSILPPDKAIALVGRTGVGKSSTANSLLGAPAFEVGSTHGTTTSIIEKPFRNEYTLRDTPGLLDESDYSNLVLEAVKRSEIVIYITVGQLYRKEIDFIKNISQSQPIWDNQLNSQRRRKLALYVNQQDIAENTKPSAAREREKRAIIEQVTSFIPIENILFGSASPVRKGMVEPPRIIELRNFIGKHIDS